MPIYSYLQLPWWFKVRSTALYLRLAQCLPATCSCWYNSQFNLGESGNCVKKLLHIDLAIKIAARNYLTSQEAKFCTADKSVLSWRVKLSSNFPLLRCRCYTRASSTRELNTAEISSHLSARSNTQARLWCQRKPRRSKRNMTTSVKEICPYSLYVLIQTSWWHNIPSRRNQANNNRHEAKFNSKSLRSTWFGLKTGLPANDAIRACAKAGNKT